MTCSRLGRLLRRYVSWRRRLRLVEVKHRREQAHFERIARRWDELGLHACARLVRVVWLNASDLDANGTHVDDAAARPGSRRGDPFDVAFGLTDRDDLS